MGLINGGSPVRFLVFFLLLFIAFPGFTQQGATPSVSAAVSLTSELSRLEKLISGNASDTEKLQAFFALIRLHQLSGNSEEALKTCESALAIFPGEGRFLLEQGRLLISLGENEKASSLLNTVKEMSEPELLIQARLLAAKLEAFSSFPQTLATLADDPDFAEYSSDIYYTLWKTFSLASWKDKLAKEFPQSSEAKIVSGDLTPIPSPLWLLFPGHGIEAVDSVSVAPAPLSTQAPAVTDTQVSPLQTGLFSREENARAFAERLQKAGFIPMIETRVINGSNYWAVIVSGGADLNATIRKLKEAGFESFPIKSKL